MLFFNTGDLFAQCFVDDREWIGSGGVGGGIVNGVDAEEEVLCAEIVVGARGAEVFADVLRSGLLKARAMPVALAGGRDWSAQGRSAWARASAGSATPGASPTLTSEPPERGGEKALARVVIGDQGDVADTEVLAIALVVGEEEELVCLRMGPPSDPPKLLR